MQSCLLNVVKVPEKLSYSLPKDKLLDSSKFKEEKLKLAEKLKFVSGRVEKFLGKGQNAGYQHLLLFPQCFQKAYILGLKVGIVW